MAKMRTKVGPIQTKCSEVKTNVWEFSTKTYSWHYRGGLGLNLFVIDHDNMLQPVIYAKNLDQAVMFAQGYEAGAALNRHPCCIGPNGSEVRDEQTAKSL